MHISVFISYLANRSKIDIEEHKNFPQENQFRWILVLFSLDILGDGTALSEVPVPVITAILKLIKH